MLGFFSSSNFYIGTWIVFPPGCCSISARSNLILLFMRARLCIGGVPLREVSLPSHWFMLLLLELVAFVDFLCWLFLVPIVYSSFWTREGTFAKSSIRSNFMIEFVGMLGVSFSKPPCMKTVASMAQTL